jgi:hypothetical protein
VRQKLDCTNVIVHDLADQPTDTKYVLFLTGILGDKCALAVDGVRDKDCIMHAWRGAADKYGRYEAIVAQWNPAIPWALVERERLDMFTGRDWAKRLSQDAREFKELVAQLDPTGENQAAEAAIPFVVVGGDGPKMPGAIPVEGYL